MIKNRSLKIRSQFLILILCSILAGCSTNHEQSVQSVELSVNENVLFEDGDDFYGDVDGDFTGRNGSAERYFLWHNSLTTADYNADITATSQGVFEMEVRDADGTMVLNKSLEGGNEPDSFSGVTAQGTPGTWQVRIKLYAFTGDGSFSLSAGD